MQVKENWIEFINELQNTICVALESVDGLSKFREDEWEREEGGGGKTRIIQGGNVFEKGGVNTSLFFFYIKYYQMDLCFILKIQSHFLSK